jgi:hypothetical protein
MTDVTVLALVVNDHEDAQGGTEAEENETFLVSRGVLGSGMMSACSSAKAVSASSKLMPCFWTFARAFPASHSKRKSATL